MWNQFFPPQEQVNERASEKKGRRVEEKEGKRNERKKKVQNTFFSKKNRKL